MNDIHLIDFYKDVGQALILLHQQFPRKTQVYVSDLIGYDEPDEYGLHSKRHEACLAAMIWLAEESFIRFDSLIQREAIDQAVLTRTCFMRLHAPYIPHASITSNPENNDEPSSIQANKNTLVYQLNTALKAQETRQLQDLVAYLFIQ